MGEHHGQVRSGPVGHIGTYLRSVRESRRLSLDAVVEMTGMLPGAFSKSYLSRIENGVLEPTFPRLYALSQVYGVPIASLAERFEVDLRRRCTSPELVRQPAAQLLRDARQLYRAGRYVDVLDRVEILLDRLGAGELQEADLDARLPALRMLRANCLIYLDRLHAAKDECEEMLADGALSDADRALALYHFARCCHQLGKLPLALMAIAVLERDVPTLEDTALSRGNLISLKGMILASMQQPDEALSAFREAIDFYEQAGDAFSACRHRINYASVLSDSGRLRHAMKQLTSALHVARDGGWSRQHAFALHGLGKTSYRLDERGGAESYLIESNKISRRHEYAALIFCNCYWLWRIARDDGDAQRTAAHRRTMRTYLPRVPDGIEEVRDFRAQEAGGGE